MTERDDTQDQRLDDLEAAEQERNDREASRDQSGIDSGQNDRIEEQERELDAVEHDTQFIDTSLPGIDTPQGSEQRLKLHVPIPHTLVTLGAIGKRDADSAPAGPSGFSLQTEKNLAAQVLLSTIIETKKNTIFHTGKHWSGLAEEKIDFSTNGDYQLGTVGGIQISAASGAGYTDPAFTVVPDMDVPEPPKVDTKGPRASTESGKATWGAIWKVWDTYSGATSLAKIKKDGLSKGIGKDQFGAKAAGGYSVFSNARKLYAGLMLGVSGAVAAYEHFYPPDAKAKKGKPKITMYADEGVSIMSPAKISIYSGNNGGVSVESPHKVGLKGGVSASMKAGCDATVFAFLSAKLESKQVAAVKGKIVSISGDLIEINAAKDLLINAKAKLGIEADDKLRVSSKSQLEVSAHEVIVGSDSDISLECDEIITVHAKNQAKFWGDKKVYVRSETEVEMMVEKSGVKITDGVVKVGVGNKTGMQVRERDVQVGTSQAYIKLTSSSFEVKGSGASKLKASMLSLL